MKHDHDQGATIPAAGPDAAKLRHDLGFFSHAEVCGILSVAPGTGFNRRSQGDWPPSIRVGRGVLYPVDKFKRWLAGRRA